MVGIADKSISPRIGQAVDTHSIILTIIVPLVSIGLCTAIWPDLTKQEWGYVLLAMAAVYEGVHLLLRRREELKQPAFAHLLMSLVFLTGAVSLLFEDDTLFVVLATEAAALHLAALRVKSKGIAVFAHFLFFMVGLIFMTRVQLSEIPALMEAVDFTPIINARALTDLWVLGLGFFLSTRFRQIAEQRIYLITGMAFAGAWWLRELDGNIEFVVILAQTLLIHYLAFRKNDRLIAATGHVFFGVLALWLTARLINPDTDATAILNIRAAVNLLPILAAVGIYKLLKVREAIFIYQLCAHIAFLALFLSEFIPLQNGQGYITIAWGVYAALLLVAGLWFNYHRLRTVAIATLFIVVAKLFLVDLANLEVLWRILLFMGFGGLFLFLSYYFQDLWRAKPADTEKTEEK
jgi:hypothetical protein